MAIHPDPRAEADCSADLDGAGRIIAAAAGSYVDDDEILTVPEVARLTKLNPTALALARQRGTGPKFIKLGHRTVGYRRGAVVEWIRQREFSSTLEAKGV